MPFILLGKRYKNDGIPVYGLNHLQSIVIKRIKSKIKQEIYQFEYVPCCICNNSEFQNLSNKDRYGIYNPVVICKNCGLIQNNPRMKSESYKDFYESDYRKLYWGESHPTESSFRLEYNRGLKIFNFLKESGILSSQDKKLLVFEVGCGSGGILQIFKENHFIVQGCDLDKEYLEFGKKFYNLNLHYGTLKDMHFERSPDIIIYSHVLEHILSPIEELALISKVLDKNGYLYIEIPGVKNINNDYEMDFLMYLQNAHVYHFTLTTFKNLLIPNGFKLIKGDNSIKCVFKKTRKLSSEYKIKNDYNEAMRYLLRLEKLRKLLLFMTKLII